MLMNIMFSNHFFFKKIDLFLLRMTIYMQQMPIGTFIQEIYGLNYRENRSYFSIHSDFKLLP